MGERESHECHPCCSYPSFTPVHSFPPSSKLIFFRTVSSILINGGHGLLNPSPASFRVASIPSFVPMAISEVAWSSTSAGPLVKMLWLSSQPHRTTERRCIIREQRPFELLGPVSLPRF